MNAKLTSLIIALLGQSAFARAPLGILTDEQAGLDAARVRTLEYSYERRAPVVYELDGERVRLVGEDGASDVWVTKASTALVKTFEDLFTDDHLSFTTQNWDAKVFASPDFKSSYSKRSAFRLPDRKLPKPTAQHPYSNTRDVEITEKKTVDGKLWFKIRLIETTACTAPNGKAVAAKHPITGKPVDGWVPLRAADGELNFWFHTRGC